MGEIKAVPLHYIFKDTVVKKINTGAELMLCLALNIHLKKIDPAYRLDLSFVKIDAALMQQPLYAMMRNETACPDGVLFGNSAIAAPAYTVACNINPNMDYDNVILERDAAGNYTFQYGHPDDSGLDSMTNINTCVKPGAPYSYICLFAKVMVTNYVNNTNYKFKVNQAGYSITEDEYSALISLIKYGNKLGEGRIELDYIDTMTAADDREWYAYCWEHKQHGLMASYASNIYSAKDKIAWFQKNNLRVGDVVVLIKRKYSKIETPVYKNRQACYPAVITGLTADGISLKYLPRVITSLTQRKQIEAVMDSSCSSIYREADKHSYNTSDVFYSWNSIGVDGYSSREFWMIIPLMNDDFTRQWLTDGVKDYLVELNSVETTYAVLEDRKIKYAKDRFLTRYFKNSVPIYDQYKQRREANLAAKRNANGGYNT